MLAERTGIPLAAVQIKPAAMIMERAFTEDPFFTYIIPDPVRRGRLLTWLFENTIRYGLRYGRVFTTPALEGIAVWLGPKKPGLTGMGILLTGLFRMPLKMSWRELERSLRLAKISEELHRQSVSGRHWYLFFIGVDPAWQGLGVGRALLQPILAQADREALACYLETNNEKNLTFYERVGFTVTGHAAGGQSGPHTWGMRRDPG